MTLPPLNEETCPAGTLLRPHTVTYTAEDIRRYLDETGERLDAYRVGGVLRVPFGMLLGQPIRIIHNNFHYETGVHTASDLKVEALPVVGEVVTIGGHVAGHFERNRSKYVTLHVTVMSGDGRLLATIDHTSIYALATREAP